jgi:hypothetical protein
MVKSLQPNTNFLILYSHLATPIRNCPQIADSQKHGAALYVPGRNESTEAPKIKQPRLCGAYFFRNALAYQSRILETTPAPTVRPPSRIAKRRPSSIAIGAISSTDNFTLSPGITISVPEGSSHAPVTSVVRK